VYINPEEVFAIHRTQEYSISCVLFNDTLWAGLHLVSHPVFSLFADGLN
jgi:hypothetical protein